MGNYRKVGIIGKTRPRNAPALAPNCLKFNDDTLARHLQPMPSTHTFFFVFVFGQGMGASGAAAQEGAK